MRFPLLAAAAAVVLASAAPAQVGIGRPAPDFAATGIDGRAVRLSAYRGRLVVLDWANPECPFDAKHYRSGNIPAMQRAAKADGIVWLTVNSAAPGKQGDFSGARLNGWMKEVGWSGAAYVRDQDGRIGRLYKATTTPHMYVIDKGGRLAYAGAIDSRPTADTADIARATNYVKQALAEVKAGRPVSRASTRAYGCTVKYAG